MSVSKPNKEALKINLQTERVSWRVVAVWWFIVLVFIMTIINWRHLQPVIDAKNYLLLWILLAVICLIFILRFSVSSKRLGKVDILEIPVYISVTSILLIAIFGMFNSIQKSIRSFLLSLSCQRLPIEKEIGLMILALHTKPYRLLHFYHQ